MCENWSVKKSLPVESECEKRWWNRHKFAEMDVLDRHLSYISNKIDNTEEQGQYIKEF